MTSPSAIALFHYLTQDDDTYFTRPSVEEGHSKECLASAMIAAIENFRDDQYTSDHDFRLFAQDNGTLQNAQEYLDTELSDCRCPLRLRQDQWHWTITAIVEQVNSTISTQTTVVFGNLTDVAFEAESYRWINLEKVLAWKISRPLDGYSFFDTPVDFMASLDWSAAEGQLDRQFA